jgi:endonuclease/exonuclease/phosphatase family metal-dependent hydrolase
MDPQTPSLVSRRTLGRLAGATALTGAAAATTATAAHAVSSTFRVASFNIYEGVTAAQFQSELAEITSRADLIGLQEVQSRSAAIRDFAAANGFLAWIPGETWGAEVTVLARASMFDRIGQGTIFVCDTGGAGTPPPPRYITWAKYVHKPSGRKITHVNNHLNAHIDDNGSPYNLPRTDDAEKHLRMIRDFVRNAQEDGQVVVTGDFNVDYADDKRVQYANFPYTVLENRQGALPGLRSNYSRVGPTGTPTLGDRRVDYVYAWIRIPEARLMDFDDFEYVWDSAYSDHNAIIARFRMQH